LRRGKDDDKQEDDKKKADRSAGRSSRRSSRSRTGADSSRSKAQSRSARSGPSSSRSSRSSRSRQSQSKQDDQKSSRSRGGGTTPRSRKSKSSRQGRSKSKAKSLPQQKQKGAFTTHQGLDFDRKIDLVGTALVAFALVSFFGILQAFSAGAVQGGLTGTVDEGLGLLFGWGKIVIPMVSLAIGVWLMAQSFDDTSFELDYFRIIGALLLFACALTWMHMLQLVDDTAPSVAAFRPIAENLAEKGEGGGWIGSQLYLLLLAQLGDWGTLSVLIAWFVVAVMFTFELTLPELWAIVVGVLGALSLRPGERAQKRKARQLARSDAVDLARPEEAGAQQMTLATAAAASGEKKAPSRRSRSKQATSGQEQPAEAEQKAAPEQKPAEAKQPATEKTAEKEKERSQPVIRRRGVSSSGKPGEGADQAAGDADDKKAAAQAGEAEPAKADDEQASDARNSRRLLPQLRRSRPRGEQAAAEAGDKVGTDQVDQSQRKSGGQLGFLRRSKPKADDQQADDKQAPDAAAKTGQQPGEKPSTGKAADQPGEAGDKPRGGAFERPRPKAAEAEQAGDKPAGQPTPGDKAGQQAARQPDEKPGIPVPPKAGDRPAGRPARPGGPSRLRTPGQRPDQPDAARPESGDKPAASRDAAPAGGGGRPGVSRPDARQPGEGAADKPQSPFRDRTAARNLPSRHLPGDQRPDAADKAGAAADAGNAGDAKPDAEAQDAAPADGKPGDHPARPAGRVPRRPAFRRPSDRRKPAPPDQAEDDADADAAAAAESGKAAAAGAGSSPEKAPPAAQASTPQADAPKTAVSPARPDQAAEKVEAKSADKAEDKPEPENETPAKPARPEPKTASEPAPKAEAARAPESKAPAKAEEAKDAEESPRPRPPIRRAEPVAAAVQGANAPKSRAKRQGDGKQGDGKLDLTPPDFRKLLHKGDEQSINDEILLDKARVIEDTLQSFGAPGNVVEVNPGPVITQFGVEPDYLVSRSGKKTRVKVSAIARLDADLALALAARTIRIEAPVPGKGFVGIEVPNDEVALVSLHDIMDSPEFRRIDSHLRIALGLSVDGSPVAADLTTMPHLLIAGTTGSGKSVCVNSIISCLLLQNSPEDVQFIMVDPKRVELTGYNGIPHLVAPVVVDLERIVGVLQWIQREMEERYRKFADISARNILDYNNKIDPGTPKMPYYVVIVDELADLMMLAPDETERLLARLAQMARATGIHLIISTQRPSVDIITGLIKANFPARIAFAVASSVDSRVILDQPGAEKLLGRGDMLYQSPDAAAPLRMQGVFVSDEEISRITSYWKGVLLDEEDAAKLASPSVDITFTPSTGGGEDTAKKSRRKSSKPAQRAFWDDTGKVQAQPGTSAGAGGNGSDKDELYGEAVELVQRLNKASISLLQRRLRIGYTRAARLIDLMEADGIVGPAESGSKPREVLKPAGGD
jgi:DNA segregation ATPase FtsK/SpoIIIE, S-DNA-T family